MQKTDGVGAPPIEGEGAEPRLELYQRPGWVPPDDDLTEGMLALAEAYWRYQGDPDAMTDWLMLTVWRPVVEAFRGRPPVVVEGEVMTAYRAIREMVGMKVHETIRVIEGPGQIWH